MQYHNHFTQNNQISSTTLIYEKLATPSPPNFNLLEKGGGGGGVDMHWNRNFEDPNKNFKIHIILNQIEYNYIFYSFTKRQENRP